MKTIQKELHALWENIKQNRLFKLRYFLLDLFLHAKYDLMLIDPNNVKLNMSPLKIPECQTCPRNCCRGVENTVSLRLIDIARLLDAQLDEYIEKDNKIQLTEEIQKKFPKIRRHIQSDTWRLFPVLKRVNDICPLLDTENNCTIYDVRPLTCRRYPYSLEENLQKIKFSSYCINPKKIDELTEYAKEHFYSAIDNYNEKVKDLILIHHAKKELAEIGLYKYLTI